MKEYTSYYNSPIGIIELKCTEDALISALFDVEMKAASETHPILTETEQQLTEYFAGKRTAFELPISQSGSAFQQKVWNLLCEIGCGKTISYATLAKQYGDMKAIRAIASANGKNKISIIVPCHRVIGTDGSLTGYAGGLWRKKWLLEHERAVAGTHQLTISEFN